MISLPRLYAIVDPALLEDHSVRGISSFARELIAGGAMLIQLRNKEASAAAILSQARELQHIRNLDAGKAIRLIMNDRADLCLAADFDGVHVGQEDLSPQGARSIVGNRRSIGVSTHNSAQVRTADQSDADYIAIGPVFKTTAKRNPDPTIGLKGVQAARRLTAKPLVAIGGITLENCQAVVNAGADSVAVISALLGDPRKRAEAFLRQLT